MKQVKILASIFAAGIAVASYALFKPHNANNESSNATQTVTNEEAIRESSSVSAKNEEFVEYYSEKQVMNVHQVKVLPTVIEYPSKVDNKLLIIEDYTYGFKKNKLVHPPVKGMEPKGVVYKIDPTKPISLATVTGSVINIPENAFASRDGKIITEQVEVYYCEYNDPFDFVTSGIPMTYDSGGQVNHFESAGMFDIQAKSEGKDLVLAKDKNIKIEVASTNRDDDFNFYELDENKGGWVNKESNLIPVSPRMGMGLFDNTLFSERYTNLNYFTDYSRGGRRLSFRRDRNKAKDRLMQGVTTVRGVRSAKKMVHMRSSFRIKRMPKQKGDSASMARFKLVPRSVRRRKYSNPAHLRYFIDKTWIYKGDLTRFEFWMEFAKAKRCHDVRVIYEEGSDNFTFELKSSQGFVQINAYTFNDNPETVSSGKVQSSINKFTRAYHKYASRLEKLEEEYDTAIAVKGRNFALMSEGYDVNVNDEGYQLVSRTVTLTNLGLYNCDRIMLMRNPKNVLAKFKVDGMDEILEPKVSYVIDKKANGMFSYGGNVITIDPDYTKCIILVLGNDRIAYVKGKDVKSGYSGPNSDFVAKIATSKTREELKEELGL